jgi:hypothetical protein
MTYIVHIKNNENGEIRTYQDDLEFSEFIWSEGNYSCDCNRHIFFTNRDEMEHPCGEDKYTVVDVTTLDGLKTEEMMKFLGIKLYMTFGE